MSNSKCVYYKEKEQKSIDGGITWVDTGNFRKGALISTQAAQCGSFTDEYRWIKADYVCDNGNKYNGYKQQVSHDNGGNWSDTGVVNIGDLIEENSKDCGYDEQWFTMTDKDFICDEGSKYKKMEMKYTRDSGTTWNSFDPPKFGKGYLIEENSSVCPHLSMKVTYTDGSVKKFYDLTTIKYYHVEALAYHKRVKEVVIYDGVTAIGEEAFEDCTNLTSITIPNSVTEIGNQAFNNCSSLTSVTIPDGVTIIGDSVFWGCSSLTSITIPDSVTTIGNQAFSWCNKITSITIPNKVKTIGDYAFRACDSITSITIPDSVISIGKEAFYPSGIKTITFEATTPPNLGDNAITNIDTTTTTIYVPASSVDKYKSATDWSSYADNIYPIGAAIPAMKVAYLDGTEKTFINLKKIVKNTDSNKTNAKEIEIYDSVVRINIDAFENCTGLTSVKLGSSVKTIGIAAFANCSSLTSITLPNSVKTIGDNVFWGCSSLRRLTVNATTPPTLGVNAIPSNVSTIYVPASSVNAYKSAYGWSNYASKIQAIP